MKRLVATVLTLVMVFSMFSALGREVSYGEDSTKVDKVDVVIYGEKDNDEYGIVLKQKPTMTVEKRKEKDGHAGTVNLIVKYEIADSVLDEISAIDEDWDYNYHKGMTLNRVFFRVENSNGAAYPLIQYTPESDAEALKKMLHFSGGMYTFEVDLGMFQEDAVIVGGALEFYGPFKAKKETENQGSEQDNGSGNQSGDQNSGQDENNNNGQDNNPGNTNSGSDTDSQQESESNSSENNASEGTNTNNENDNAGVDTNNGGSNEETPSTTPTETVEIEEEEVALGSAESTTESTTPATSEAQTTPSQETTEATTSVEKTSSVIETTVQPTTETETVEIEEEEAALGTGNQDGNDSGIKGTKDAAGGNLPHTGNLPNELFYIVGALLLVGGILIKTVRAK